MCTRPPLVATVIAAFLAAVCASALGYLNLSGAHAASSPTPGAGVLRLGSNYSKATGYGRYSYVIVSRDDAAAAASQPGKSLVYHSGTDVNTQWDCGVPYSQATANGWLLKDSSGSFLVNTGYANNYIGDVGNPAYQAAWASNVASFLSSKGADGVFIDDVLASVGVLTDQRLSGQVSVAGGLGRRDGVVHQLCRPGPQAAGILRPRQCGWLRVRQRCLRHRGADRELLAACRACSQWTDGRALAAGSERREQAARHRLRLGRQLGGMVQSGRDRSVTGS